MLNKPAALLTLACALALAQTPLSIPIDQNLNAQDRHARRGDMITWTRNGDWHVSFLQNRSPCSQGSQLDSHGGKICTINVGCASAGSPACKYPYVITGGQQPPHDPEIQVDP
jgi:hypothetical protein